MSKPLRVLLVEDSEDDALLLLETLRQGGYEPDSQRVDTAEGLRAAIADKYWDVVLCDYSMPGFDAPAAIRILTQSGRAMPLIVVSGTVGEETAVDTLKLGADDYLLKGNLVRLAPAVERAVRAGEASRRHSAVEHMKSLIMAHSLDLICTIDARGQFLEMSAAAEKILGYSASELDHRAFMDFVHPDDRERSAAELRAILGGRQTKNFENRYLRKDGSAVPMMWSAFWSEPDRVIIAVGRDMTEHEGQQEALRLALERLQLAVKAGRTGIWDYDLATGTVDWDDQMLALYGRPRADLEPGEARWHASVHPEDSAALKEIFGRGRRGEVDSFETEFRILRANHDGPRRIRAMGTVLRDRSGHPSRMIGVNWDVTEERAREERLSEALQHEKELTLQAQAGERAKSEFLAVMSHEIRTPMHGVLGFAELLANFPSLPDECRNYVQTIAQSGEALLRVLDDILDFGRLEAGKIEIEETVFSPRALLQEIRARHVNAASDKLLKLLVVVDDAVPEWLRGDAARLRQILQNLVGNAVKFTESGSVTIGMWPAQRPDAGAATTYEFSVKDTGSGIATGQMERIFQPFTQADSSPSRRRGGAGLGLTISHRLAELLGGDLVVRSVPGQGSEFVVHLPFEPAPPDHEAGSDAQPDALDATFAAKYPLGILLVEDDRVNLKLILALIRRLGYEPMAAQNGREAVELFRSERPQCVLMDLQMPEMDGIEATEKIRAAERAGNGGKAAFIAALTANIFPADRERCFDAGMDSYLNKPVKLSTLAAMLRQASDYVQAGRA
jgi:PAS domain S-box-containing protein